MLASCFVYQLLNKARIRLGMQSSSCADDEIDREQLMKKWDAVFWRMKSFSNDAYNE
jgi:hypothetical protein